MMLGSDEHKAGALRTISVQNCIINQCSLLRGIPVFHTFSYFCHDSSMNFPSIGTGLCPETTGPGTVHGYCFSAVRGDQKMPVGLSGVFSKCGETSISFSLSKYHKISNIKHLLVDFCCGSPLCWKDPYYVYHDAS